MKKPLRFAWPETARVVLSQLDWMSILDHSATTGNYIFDSEVCLGVDQVIEGIYYHSLPTWARSVCGLVVVDYLYMDSRHIRYFAIFRHLMMMIGGIVVLWGVLKGHIVDRWLKKRLGYVFAILLLVVAISALPILIFGSAMAQWLMGFWPRQLSTK